MAFTVQNKGKEKALGGLRTVAVKFSLHSANPGSLGASNEISGGSPAYARQTGSWNAPSGGSMTLSGTLVFDVGSGKTVAFVGLWNSAGTEFYGYWNLTSTVFSQQGTLTVTSAELDM